MGDKAADFYTQTFNKRGDSYNEASKVEPRARSTERELLIELLGLRTEHLCCDAPAGGGYLADGFKNMVDNPKHIICVEPAEKFGRAICRDYAIHIAPITQMPIDDSSIDRLGSLAGLHHLSGKQAFIREAYRVLKRRGILAVADVRDGTPVAEFLNGPVDKYSLTGHRGMFLKPDELTGMLRHAGFRRISEEEKPCPWVFRSEENMVRYCKLLFGLVKATPSQVRKALHEHFQVEYEKDCVKLPWSLQYASGQK